MQPRPARRRPTVDDGAVDEEQDLQDLRRVLAGETDAFAGIVRRWQGPLMNLAWRYTRDRAQAEDWAQEAFLKAYRRLSSFKGDAAFSTWLFALAINVYRSRMRRWIPPSVSLDDAPALTEPSRVDLVAEGHDRAAKVRRAVAFLPPRYRDAVVLFYFHEMDLAAAARRLQIPEGTLKARLNRARALLERRLGPLLAVEPAVGEA